MLRVMAGKCLTIIQRHSSFRNMYTYPDIAEKYFWLFGSWEAWNIKIIKKYFCTKENTRTFLDVDANLGCYSTNLADNFEIVLSFEAAPIARRVLEANILSNCLTNCLVKPVAVGNQNGEINLHYNPKNSGMASVNPSHQSENTEYEKVAIVRLDDAIGKLKIKFIKIDVEGAELQVLKGAEKILRTQKPTLQIELDGNQDYEGGQVILAFLKTCGYMQFFQRPRHIIDKILRRMHIQDTRITELNFQKGVFYQAVWCLHETEELK